MKELPKVPLGAEFPALARALSEGRAKELIGEYRTVHSRPPAAPQEEGGPQENPPEPKKPVDAAPQEDHELEWGYTWAQDRKREAELGLEETVRLSRLSGSEDAESADSATTIPRRRSPTRRKPHVTESD